MTRRSFLKSAAAAGVAVPLAGSLLGACGDTGARPNQLVVAAATTPPSLDWELVFGREVYDHVFNLNDRLTRWKQIPAPDEEGGFDLAWQAGNFEEITEPRMAEGWEVTNGGRTYTFSLRRGWPSHAGNEFTAADVKWTFERSFALHGITSFYNSLSTIERPEDVKVLDKHTVRFELAEPGPDLLLTMSTFWRVIVDSELAKTHATSGDPWAKRWLKNHDAGFGPFKLDDLSPGRHVVWVAHDEHPFPPMLDQITFREVPASPDRLAALTAGDAQVAQFLSPTEMQQVQNRAGLRLWNFQGYVLAQCPMNPKYPPLDDVRVRQALSYATPYQEILDKVYRGFAGPASGPLSDHAAGFDPYLHPYTYDPGRARRLLREAGHGNGFTTTLAYNTADPLGAPVSAQLQRAYKDVGVTLDLEALPPSEYPDALFAGERPMFFYQGGADSPDPAYALGLFYQSKSSNNWVGYKSAKADACLAAAGRPQLAWDQRVEKHKRCAEIIADDAPWLWIAQPGFQVSTRSEVTGINWYAGEAVDWSKVGYTT
ncbi:MAG TPA: ABC transporter substrate-binding protein [Baekduia sp.]|uniref:ABC transporter substrate-binding protein n=1 Tax=Baekduia sp. TaxID=2600305 RepID=UPI002BE7202D|nr:ABC transporter substrate-binding protein [Baekduia sp.]HMJ32445.1 ABC transporter substrate-binding protein [Baekduia sp.]